MNVNHKENPTLVCCIPQTARLVLYYLVRFFTVNQTQTLMNEPKIWHEGVRWEVRWTLWVNSLHLLLGGRHIWAPNLKAAVKTFPSRPRMSTSFGWIVCPLWKSEPNLTEIHFYSKIILACSGSTGQMIVWLYIFIMLKRVSLAWTTSMYHPHHRHQPTLTPMKKSQLENNNIIWIVCQLSEWIKQDLAVYNNCIWLGKPLLKSVSRAAPQMKKEWHLVVKAMTGN